MNLGAALAFTFRAALRLLVISVFILIMLASWRIYLERSAAVDAPAMQAQPTVLGERDVGLTYGVLLLHASVCRRRVRSAVEL